jgi:hypothetical protein
MFQVKQLDFRLVMVMTIAARICAFWAVLELGSCFWDPSDTLDDSDLQTSRARAARSVSKRTL